VLFRSKIEAEKLDVEMLDVDLPEMLFELDDIMSFQAKTKGLEFSITNDGPVPRTIKTDVVRLKQILLNLLSNAIKFTAKGGRISCSSEVSEDGTTIVNVSDTGIGIHKSDIPKIMEPFGQVASSDIRDHRGTGLGLPITRRLTELLGGKFLLRSEFGVGTEVSVSFPRQATSLKQ